MLSIAEYARLTGVREKWVEARVYIGAEGFTAKDMVWKEVEGQRRRVWAMPEEMVRAWYRLDTGEELTESIAAWLQPLELEASSSG